MCGLFLHAEIAGKSERQMKDLRFYDKVKLTRIDR